MLREREDGKRKVKTLDIPELDRINQDFKAGVIRFEQAAALVRDLKDKQTKVLFRNQDKPITHSENIALLESYWAKDYQFREIVAKEDRKADLLKALGVIGDLSLYTAGQEQLVAKINKAGLPNNLRRRRIARLNQLLVFARRDFTIAMPEEDLIEIKYLTFEETAKLADFVGGIDGHMILIAAASGCRIGEIFAITPSSIIGSNEEYANLFVGTQIRKNRKNAPSKKALPKNKEPRHTLVFPLGVESLQIWANIAKEDRPSRTRVYSEIVMDACRKLWPKNTDKHITFRDLRHGFAKEMRRLGYTIDEIAACLGNAPEVCRKYYAGAAFTSENIAALARRLK